MRSIARATASSSRPTAGATSSSARFMTRTSSSVGSRSSRSLAGWSRSVTGRSCMSRDRIRSPVFARRWGNGVDQARVSPLDVAILVATLLVAAAVGLVVGRRAKSTRAYVVGERDVPWWAVLLSIVATETSAVTFLSIPGKAYFGDLRFLQLPLGYVVGRIAVARLLLPRYFEGDALTAYEVLGRRFGPGVKRLTSALFLVTRSLADGLRLFLTALPLQALTGMPLSAAVAVMALVTVVYTFVGGMKAVVWTDVVQFAIYIAGGVLALAVACGDVPGGLGGIVERAGAAGKLRWLDFTPTLASSDVFWAGLVGGAFLTLATHGADQLMVQRYLSARSRGQAAVALIAS